MYVRYRFSGDKMYRIIYDDLFKLSKRGDFGDYVHFTLVTDSGEYGYYIYYPLNYDEEDYSYLNNYDSKPSYFFEIFNKTHIRFFLNEIFSNSPQINYTLLIINDTDYFYRKYELFISYYYNKTTESKNKEIYNFNNNDLKNNSNEHKIIFL